jgi:hypothetical protein
MRFSKVLVPVSDSNSSIPSSSLANLEPCQIVDEPSEDEVSDLELSLQNKDRITKRADGRPVIPNPLSLRRRAPLRTVKSHLPGDCVITRGRNSMCSNYILQNRQTVGNCIPEIKSSLKASWISRPLFRTVLLLSDPSNSSSSVIQKRGKTVYFNERRNVTHNADPDRIIDDEYCGKIWWNGKDRARCIKRRNREVHQLLTLEENESYRKAVLTVTNFCQSYPTSNPFRNSQETIKGIDFKDVHRAIGVLVTSRRRGLERIVSKSLQIQQNRAMEVAVDSMNKADETLENTSALYIRNCILKYQQQLCTSTTSTFMNSDDLSERNSRHHCDDLVLSLASYSQSLERQSRSAPWAQLLATGDAAVVAADKNRFQ